MRILTPFKDLFRPQTYRVLLFLVTAVPIGALVLGLTIAGWTSIAVLAITPLVVPVLLGYRGAVGLLVRTDGALARSLLGVEVAPRVTSGGRGFWGRGKAVLLDRQFWKQQVYLLLRMTLGFALAVGELSLLAGAIGAIAFPIQYRWSDLHFWSWQVDTLARSFVLVPAGIVVLGIGLALLRPLGWLFAWLADVLLEGPPRGGRPRLTVQARRRAVAIHASVAALLSGVQVLVWLFTTRGYFWPEWVLLPLGLVVVIHAWVELVVEQPAPLRRVWLSRGLAIHAGIAIALALFVTLVWAVTSRGYFWPEWVVLPFALLVSIHGWIDFALRRPPLMEKLGVTRAFVIHLGVWVSLIGFEIGIWALTARGEFWPAWTAIGAAASLAIHAAVERSGARERLARRVETLETTRAGAVEEQDAELRRIERNLHDGAQARLVALGMSLGMAEQKLQTDPEVAHQLPRRGARRRRRGAARAPRPRPRRLPAGAFRPWARSGAGLARRPEPAANDDRGRPRRPAEPASGSSDVFRRRRGARERDEALGRRRSRNRRRSPR
jgi:signal transduction histidine kinase